MVGIRSGDDDGGGDGGGGGEEGGEGSRRRRWYIVTKGRCKKIDRKGRGAKGVWVVSGVAIPDSIGRNDFETAR